MYLHADLTSWLIPTRLMKWSRASPRAGLQPTGKLTRGKIKSHIRKRKSQQYK